jgi:hypothetical protein
MDKSNKSVKGLKEGWNKMQLEPDELKKRQDMCEWRGETWEQEVRKSNLCLVWMKEMERGMNICRG